MHLPADGLFPKVKVFVSYARADSAVKTTFVSKLNDSALDQVTDFWIDQHLDLGLEWKPELEHRLRGSAIVLLLVTDSFLKSEYCMKKELPVAVQRHAAGTARVVFVRMTDQSVIGTPLDRLDAWPASGPLGGGTSDPAAEISMLRTELKRWVAEEVKKSRGAFGEPQLWYLHQQYGVTDPQGRRLGAYVAIATLLGSLSGWVVGSAIVPHLPAGLFRVIVTFSILDAFGIQISGFLRSVQLWRETKESPFSMGSVWVSLSLGSFALGLSRGAIVGLAAGLIFGSLGPGGTARWLATAIGALLAAIQTFSFLSAVRPKYLQVFLDIGDRSGGCRPERDPWDRVLETRSVHHSPLESVPAPTNVTNIAPKQPVETVNAGPPDDLLSQPLGDKEQRTPLETASRWRRLDEWKSALTKGALRCIPLKDEVALRMLVLYAQEDSGDYRQLDQALAREGVGDMCLTETLICGSTGTEEPEYWRQRLAEFDVFVPLLSAASVDTPTNRALGIALELGIRVPGMAPILLEKMSLESSSLLSFQAWPSPPVREWHVTKNAWSSAVIQLRKKFIGEFQDRLFHYVEKRDERIGELESKKKLEALRGKSEREGKSVQLLDSWEAVDLYRKVAERSWHTPYFKKMFQYPYRHHVSTFRIREAVVWVCLAASAAARGRPVGTLSVGSALLSVLVMGGVLVLLALQRETKLQTIDPGSRHFQRPSGFVTLAFSGSSDIRGRIWIVRKSLLVASLAAIWVLVTVFAAKVWATGWLSWKLGALAGLGAYLLTSHRVPKVLMEKLPPSPQDIGISFRRTGIFVELPRKYHPSRVGNIGTMQAVDPGVAEVHAARWQFSFLAVTLSILQALAVALGSLLVALSLRLRFGESPFWSVAAAAIFNELAVTWLGSPLGYLKFCFRFPIREGFGQLVLNPVTNGILMFLIFAGLARFAIGAPYGTYLFVAFFLNLIRCLLRNGIRSAQKMGNE
jgi:hypothetical protein